MYPDSTVFNAHAKGPILGSGAGEGVPNDLVSLIIRPLMDVAKIFQDRVIEEDLYAFFGPPKQGLKTAW